MESEELELKEKIFQIFSEFMTKLISNLHHYANDFLSSFQLKNIPPAPALSCKIVLWVTEFEELVSVGNSLLVGFHQGLEFLRRPPINKTSELIENIFKANETRRVLTYVEAGCVNDHDSIQNISKCSKFTLQALYIGFIHLVHWVFRYTMIEVHTCHIGLNDCLSKVVCMELYEGIGCHLCWVAFMTSKIFSSGVFFVFTTF
ncbi:hypothetical protein U1Q18_012037, partial [Sarracenia purpurea var. burkii]